MIVLLTRHSNNQPVSLTKQIADSGEGQVWSTNLKGYLAKIYHDPSPARIAKLKVMLANPPADPMLSHNHVSIAWVSDLLKDSNGKYLGFLMPEIKNSKQLSSVYNPRRRKIVAPGFNWYYLHVTALNTAWIIQAIHAKGYVLGDIKLENILVNDRAMTAVIDTDSFQVRDSQSNKVYRCTVGSEGFTPPELLGKDFDTTNQTEIHDRFRLGVLIHYLLFGYHPFSGNWTGVGESPDQTELIKQGYWYGGHNSPIRASKATIPLDVVHPELEKLFLKCFNEGHTQPNLRPTALDWHNALEVAVNQLTSCSRVDSHYYSKTYGKCYWCDRAADLGVDIFPGSAVKTPSTATQNVSPPKLSNQTSKQTSSAHSNNSSPTTISPIQSSSSTSQSILFSRKTVIKSNHNFSSTINLTRRRWLKMAGLTGAGLVTAIVALKIFKKQPTFIQKQTVLKPKQMPLQTFEFETVTVDVKGEVVKRDLNKQVNFFEEDLGNGITLDMVSIPDGNFIMGSPEGEGYKIKHLLHDEKPQHEVNIQSFLMGKYSVTQKQWRAIASLPKVNRDLEADPSVFNGDDLPVEKVSWDDALEFCQRLSLHTGKEYRLPSEAEWEYACRAGTTTPFYFGETITGDLANYRASKIYANEPQGEYRAKTTPVGSFLPNSYGLYDMHGNVREWCEDNWQSNYEGAPTDGSAWLSGTSSKKVIRGGSWYYYAHLCRSASRSGYMCADRSSDFGFRVVCVVPKI